MTTFRDYQTATECKDSSEQLGLCVSHYFDYSTCTDKIGIYGSPDNKYGLCDNIAIAVFDTFEQCLAFLKGMRKMLELQDLGKK